MPRLTTNQLGALVEVVSRHAEDEEFYLDGKGGTSPLSDYKEQEELEETIDTREHIWAHCADALEALQASAGEIDQCRRLANRWAELRSKNVMAVTRSPRERFPLEVAR